MTLRVLNTDVSEVEKMLVPIKRPRGVFYFKHFRPKQSDFKIIIGGKTEKKYYRPLVHTPNEAA
jgi:hypothetical protein